MSPAPTTPAAQTATATATPAPGDIVLDKTTPAASSDVVSPDFTAPGADANRDGKPDVASGFVDEDGDGIGDTPFDRRPVVKIAGRRFVDLGLIDPPKDVTPTADEIVRTHTEYHIGPLLRLWRKWGFTANIGGGFAAGMLCAWLLLFPAPAALERSESERLLDKWVSARTRNWALDDMDRQAAIEAIEADEQRRAKLAKDGGR